jgi:hypothetical protein
MTKYLVEASYTAEVSRGLMKDKAAVETEQSVPLRQVAIGGE